MQTRVLPHKVLASKLILLLTLLLFGSSSFATIKYVMYGGNGNKNGTSWANASDLLRQTIENALAGDTIWVAGGDNTGNGVVNYDDHFRMDYKMVINKNIKIFGGFPRPNVKPGVSNPQMKDRNMVLYASIFDGTIMFAAPVKSLFEQSVVLTDALFDGFYVVNATDEKGAGIRMKDGLTISNCVFVNNKATSATEGGGAIYMEGGTLVNCIITNNECTNKGAAIYAKGNSKIINCTVVNNKTNGGDGRAICLDGTLPTVNNTILWNNAGTGNDATYVNGATVAQIRHSSYNLLPGSLSDNTQISTSNTGVNAPYFVNPNSWQGIHTDSFYGYSVPNSETKAWLNVFSYANLGDWYLQDARSVMFDKGDQTLIPAFLKTDIENNPRVRNKFVDIGCYELQPINVLGWTLSNPKTYNGNNYGSVTNKGAITPAIANVGVDSVMVRYDDRNVGINKKVTLSFILNGTESAKFFAEDTVTTGTIVALPITVTADSIPSSTTTTETFSKIYGQPDPTFSYRTAPALATGDSFSGALSRSSSSTETVGTYAVNQGTLSAGSNYTTTFVSTNYSIRKKSIVTTAAAVSKIYDGTNAAAIPALTFAPGQLIAGDAGNVTASATTATYDTKNVGTNKTVTVSNISIGGAASGNYSVISTTPNNASSITPLALTIIPDSVTASTATTESFSKIYGTADPIFTYRSSPQLKSGDTFSGALDRSGGTDQTVRTYNIILGNLTAGTNYTLSLTSNPVNYQIRPKSISVSNIRISERPYTAGNFTAPVSYWGDIVGAEFGDVLKIDSLAVTNSYYASDALGGNKTVLFTPALLTLQGTQKSNYRLIQPVVKGNVGVASTSITISNIDVTYDSNPKLVTITTNPSDAAHTTVVYKNAGTNTLVAAPSLAGSYDVFVDVSGGSYVGSSQGTLLIRKKTVTALVPDVAKEYDGTVFVSPIPSLTFGPGEIETSDVLAVSVSGDDATFDDKNIGAPKVVTVAGIKITGTASNNYQVMPVSSNTNSSIFVRPIDPTIYIQVADTTKEYDGNRSIATPSLTIKGLLGGDDFNAIRTSKTAIFDTKDVGTNKTVTVNDTCWTFSNPTLAANYSWATSYNNTNSSITTRPIDTKIYIQVADTTKEYDGNRSIATPSLTIKGLLGGDDFNAIRTSKTAIFDTKDVGTNKTVTVNDTCWTFSNPTLAANYSWATSYNNANSSITTRPIDTKIYIQVADTTKEYDGNRSIATPSLTIKGLLGGDDFNAIRTSKTAIFDTKDVGTNKTVTVNDTCWTFSNPTLAANYSWATSYNNTNSAITTHPIDPTIFIVVADTTKEYDGNRSIATPSLTIKGLLGGDDFTAIRTSKTAIFDTKDVGTNKTVTVNDTCWTFSNPTLAANYSWATSYSNINNSITSHPIDASIYIEVADTTKVYDGNTAIAVPTLTIHGLLGGDEFTVIRELAVANFNSKDVADTKTISVSGYTFSNPILAQNYTWLPNYLAKKSTITPLPITITPDEGQRRKYDEPETPIIYTTLPSPLPNNETLNGQLARETGNDVGIYKIYQGSVTNSNNPNYDISFISDVDFEIYSGILMELKWGYSLVVDNTGDRFIDYQWYKNETLINGQSLQHYSIEKELCGTYKVLVTFADGTKVFSQDTLFNNCQSTKQLLITPTLVKKGGTISIKVVDEYNDLASRTDEFTILIYSIDGINVSSSKCQYINDFEQLAPTTQGAYILKIMQADKHLATKKIVVY